MAGMWYYSDKKEQKGPVPFEELRGLVQSGRIKPTDLVWQEGTRDWVRASLVDGLFDGGRGPQGDYDQAGDEPGPRARNRDDGGSDRPRRRDEVDRPRRREPARRSDGMSNGLKIGLIVGGIALFLIVIAVILIVVLAGGGGSGGTDNYTITMMPGQTNQRHASCRAGQRVQVSVNTTLLDGFHADVDCVVFDPSGRQVASDHFPGKDCNVNFNATMTGSYRVEVLNLGPGRASSHVTIRR